MTDQLRFKTEEEAHAYWEEHFGGNNKDIDKEEAAFMEWCSGVIIDEADDE